MKWTREGAEVLQEDKKISFVQAWIQEDGESFILTSGTAGGASPIGEIGFLKECAENEFMRSTTTTCNTCRK